MQRTFGGSSPESAEKCWRVTFPKESFVKTGAKRKAPGRPSLALAPRAGQHVARAPAVQPRRHRDGRQGEALRGEAPARAEPERRHATREVGDYQTVDRRARHRAPDRGGRRVDRDDLQSAGAGPGAQERRVRVFPAADVPGEGHGRVHARAVGHVGERERESERHPQKFIDEKAAELRRQKAVADELRRRQRESDDAARRQRVKTETKTETKTDIKPARGDERDRGEGRSPRRDRDDDRFRRRRDDSWERRYRSRSLSRSPRARSRDRRDRDDRPARGRSRDGDRARGGGNADGRRERR